MGKSKRREKPDTSAMASASSEPEMRRDTIVNIGEGSNMTTVHGDDAANNLVTLHANPFIMRESGEVQPEMNPRAPPTSLPRAQRLPSLDLVSDSPRPSCFPLQHLHSSFFTLSPPLLLTILLEEPPPATFHHSTEELDLRSCTSSSNR